MDPRNLKLFVPDYPVRATRDGKCRARSKGDAAMWTTGLLVSARGLRFSCSSEF